MSWNQPQGGYQGGGYNQQQGGYNQGGGYGRGGYNQGAQPFYPGGYNNNMYGQQQYGQQQYGQQQYGQQQYGGYNQGGMYGQQGGFNQGAYNAQPFVPGQPYFPQQQQQQQPQPVVEATPEPPQPKQSDLNKLQLGGSRNSEPIVMPKKAKGGKLVIGGKKEEPKAETPAPAPEATTESAPTEEKPASPTTAAEASSADDSKPETPVTATEKPKEAAAKKRKPQKEYVRDPRPHFNIVFCGHVDSGKSTISGRLLCDFGVVDEREMDKLRREAAANHREGWEMAYVMDVSEEERERGKTHETGAGYFETDKRRVTVLDAPGHKAFVPSMIGGATQADICVLVISSRTGEFETGYEKGGQTREHAMLVRTCGVKQMICVINKMDDNNWDKERYDEIVGKLRPFLKSNGYDEKTNLIFIPTSGLSGLNLEKRATACAWYTGPTVMEFVNNLTLPEAKKEDDPLCIPLVGGYKDDGKVYMYGKCESGSVVVGDRIQILPSKTEVTVEGITIETTELEKAYPGDNVHLRVRGIEDSDIHAGYVATNLPGETNLKAVEYFQARIVILDVKNIVSAGSKMMIHIHAAQEEVSFHKLLAKIDKKTNEVTEKEPTHVKAGDVVMARMELERPLVMDVHKDFDKIGRFMLREDGKTVAIGLVTKLYESTKQSLAKSGKAF